MDQRRPVNEAAEEFTSLLIFNRVVENLRTQAEENQQLTQQLSDQHRRQREATQALTQESVNAYMEFVGSIFSYWEGNVERAQSWTASAQRNKEAIELLDGWIADDSGYDEESWPELKASLNRDRPSDRKLFVD